MKAGFYSKIATENIKKNPRLYIPRILAESGLMAGFYIIFSLSQDDRMANAMGGYYLKVLMGMGTVVLGLLSLVIIFYINSFLMKQRKNEYGLYNVLGLEKKHIGKILFFESLFASAASVIIGLCAGLLLYKLCSLFICKLFQIKAIAGFYYFSPLTIILPALIFAFIAFVFNRITIQRMKVVEMLSEKHSGEKEPKVKWLLLIAGVLSLGAGYFIALSVKSPLEAIFLFFIAVILVIIGTYCLFITGTTFILKCLKNNKNYYYNKKHMPAVSGLLFRMKQNAVGLASIAILSTCVLVMVSTTVSLYSGATESINSNYPQQLYLSAFTVEKEKVNHISQEELEKIVREASDKNGVEIESVKSEQFLDVSYVMRDGKLLSKTEVKGGWETDEITGVMYITEETYNQLTGSSLNLKKDEIAFCRISSPVNDSITSPEALTIADKEYKVTKNLELFPINNNMGSIVRVIGIVVSDKEALGDIYTAQKESYGKNASEYTSRIGVIFKDEDKVSKVGNALNEDIFSILRDTYESDEDVSLEANLDTKWEAKNNVLEMYGTFLFLGILLGFVCLFSTILIIYYKQISEGYEDRQRFQIMEKIGMEQNEVKKTISSQLVLQFFLPLITAAIHTAVAFPILLKLLKILMLTNSMLFLICTIITFAVFSIVYIVVYKLTAKTYYKIVH